MFSMLGKLLTGTATLTFTIPLMLLPMVLYVMRGILGPIQEPALQWTLISGATTHLTWGQLIILIATVVMVFEAAKATVISARGILDHVLSVFLLIAAVVLYIIRPEFGDAIWLMLVFFQAGDVLAGVIINIAVSRRDIGLTHS